ncbi:MAG: hypothetical protein ACOVMN_03815, partial [Flexibacteraceae bacterium]
FKQHNSMIKIINPNYTLENVLFNSIMEIAVYISAPRFEVRCKGNILSEVFDGDKSIDKTFKIEPAKEGLDPLDFDCLLINESNEIADYEVNIVFKQGNETCGVIKKSGKLKQLQKVHLQHIVRLPSF